MSGQGDLHQISAEIGGIKTAVELMTDMWKSQEQSASAGRAALHQKFDIFKDQVSLQIAGLSIRMDRLTDKVASLEPSVTTFKDRIQSDDNEKLIEEGAKRFRIKMGGIIVTGAGAVGFLIHELVTYLKHP